MKVLKNVISYAIAITLITSIITHAYAKEQIQFIKLPEPPKPSPGSTQVNMTEVIPRHFRYNVTPGTPQVLRFQNMVMEINTDRRMVMNISVEENVQLHYFAMHVEMNQNMYLNIRANSTPPENIPAPMYGINRYLSLEPNTTEPIRATLRLFINETEMTREMNRRINMEHLTWCYWNGTDWENVQSKYMEDGFLEAYTTHFSHWTIKEQRNPREMPTPDRPGIPTHTQAYNYTDVTPQGFQHQVEQYQGTMFQFNNTAMYFNSTHRLQLEITAENQFREHLFKLEVEPREALKIEMHMRTSRPSGIQAPERHMGFYCDIEPNATITRARIGVEIDPEQVQARNMTIERLTWAYWNGTHWDPVESTVTEENILEAETTHLSIWTILEQVESTEPSEKPSETDYYIYGVAALLVMAVVAYLIYNRRN